MARRVAPQHGTVETTAARAATARALDAAPVPGITLAVGAAVPA